MKIVLFGRPGSGKGTQAKLLSEKYGIEHISTGEIFRQNMENHTPLGEEVRSVMESGSMVSDDLTIRIAEDAIQKKESWILDGFPRTEVQSIWTFQRFPEAKYIFINTSKEVCFQRIQNRMLIEDRPEDASEKSIKKRFDVYQALTVRAIDFIFEYGKLIPVDGNGSKEEVFESIIENL